MCIFTILQFRNIFSAGHHDDLSGMRGEALLFNSDSYYLAMPKVKSIISTKVQAKS